ncbi:MAG: HNH endonuclease [Lentisphaerae bacterium]|jgi:5-methylcytosine-specific restriction endonuclease McrA|nr:HNH endonuclease [Lentisphaerota bacterium]
MSDDWIDLQPDARHVARERARARELRASAWWKRQIAAGRCHYCGKTVAPSALTMDHVIPVARGGRSVKGNVVPACSACNRTKSHLTPVEQILATLGNLTEEDAQES